MAEKSLIKNYLSDDYEQSYKIILEKYDYLSSFHEKFIKMKNVIEKFKKDYNELFKIKEDNFSIDVQEQDYNQIFILIKDEINLSIKENMTIINESIERLSNILESIKSNKMIFVEYLNIQNTFNTKLIEYENSKTKYLASAEKAELFTFENKERQINDNKNEIKDKKIKLQNIAKEDKEKYMKKYSELNDIFNTFNEKQTSIFNINKKLKIIFYQNLIDSLFSLFQYSSEGVKGDEKAEKIKNNIMKYTDKKENIEKMEYKELPKIELTQYKSKLPINDLYDFQEVNICIMACEEMTKFIGKYAEDMIEEYLKKVETNEKIKRIISSTNKINKKDEQYIKDILNTEMGQNLFIINFNQLRTNGILEKTKEIIEFFGRMITLILDKSKEKNNYKFIKSCMILSQTFYYIDIKKEKIYIIDLISNNKWLKSPQFWRDFIKLSINNEFNKIKIKKDNINDLLCSQLIPYIKIMKEFKIDDRIILKIVDEFILLYDNIYKFDPGFFSLLFSFINNDEKEIEKLRNEYKNNPDLEKELYQENFEKNDDKANEDKK